MIHSSSDLNFRLQVAQLVLTRMSYLRERRSLQLSEKRLFHFKSYNVGVICSDPYVMRDHNWPAYNQRELSGNQQNNKIARLYRDMKPCDHNDATL